MGITMDDALREDNTKKRTDVVQKKRDDVFACRCGRGYQSVNPSCLVITTTQ